MNNSQSEPVTVVKTSPDSSSDIITLMIVDDHPVVREGLAAIFKSQKDIKIVAEAGDGDEACKLYDKLSPDVVLLDLRMPNKDGLHAISELMTRNPPKPRIIVMTTYESEEDIRRALKAGAKGYPVKGTAPSRYERQFAQSLPENLCFRRASLQS